MQTSWAPGGHQYGKVRTNTSEPYESMQIMGLISSKILKNDARKTLEHAFLSSTKMSHPCMIVKISFADGFLSSIRFVKIKSIFLLVVAIPYSKTLMSISSCSLAHVIALKQYHITHQSKCIHFAKQIVNLSYMFCIRSLTNSWLLNFIAVNAAYLFWTVLWLIEFPFGDWFTFMSRQVFSIASFSSNNADGKWCCLPIHREGMPPTNDIDDFTNR